MPMRAGEVVRAVVELVGRHPDEADQRVRGLVESADPRQVEAVINNYGYVLLQADRPELAREIFELNTRVFPDAFNAWDSLGEAHMVLGQDEDAIRCYERSLALNEDNANAVAMITRIREGGAPPGN